VPDFSWTEKMGGNRGHMTRKDTKPQPRPRQDTTSPHGAPTGCGESLDESPPPRGVE